jgi:hypothetical protein
VYKLSIYPARGGLVVVDLLSSLFVLRLATGGEGMHPARGGLVVVDHLQSLSGKREDGLTVVVREGSVC